jgi:hypothetical protein
MKNYRSHCPILKLGLKQAPCQHTKYGNIQLSGIIDGRSTIFNASKDDLYSSNGSLAIDIHLSFFHQTTPYTDMNGPTIILGTP